MCHVHDELAHFGVDNELIVYSKHNNGGGITTIHGFSKGPSWLTSFFWLVDMYILITSLGLEWNVCF